MSKKKKSLPDERPNSSNQLNKVNARELKSRLENIESLLLEREAFINNLIARIGDLESELIAKDSHITNISSELQAQVEHIENLDSAISQRDEHVAHLDQRNSKTLNLLENSQLATQSFEKLNKKLEILEDQFLRTNAQVSDLIENDDLLDRLNNLLTKRTEDQHRHTELILSGVANIRDEITGLSPKLLQKDDNRMRSLMQQNTDFAKEIARLENEIHHRDVWGYQTQTRIKELAGEVSAVQNSLSWKITQPIRYSISIAARLLTFMGKLLRLPYKVLTKIGWRVAPRLFHRLYHLPIMQKLRRSNATQDEHNRLQAVSLPDRPVQSMPSEHSDYRKTQAVWPLGDRIDGPTN